MEHLYLPVDNINDYACYTIVNAEVVRGYVTQPRNNSSSNYTDFYINSHYMEITGNQTWSQYTTLPTCINKNNLTNDYFYRNDFPDILIMLVIILLITVYLPYRIVSRLFGRWLKI